MSKKIIADLSSRISFNRQKNNTHPNSSFFSNNKNTILLITIGLLGLVIYVIWYMSALMPKTLSSNQESLEKEASTSAKELFALAEYSDRYPHGALGDDFEPTAILKTDSSVEDKPFIQLPESKVFETNRLILADINSDGEDEILVTVSDQQLGAANYVYDSHTGELLAQTDYIGERFRWRMLVGVIDDEKGQSYLVDVVTPHLTGTLTLYQMQENQLVAIDQKEGYFSHEYGSASLDGAEIVTRNNTQVLRITPDFEQWQEFVVKNGALVPYTQK